MGEYSCSYKYTGQSLSVTPMGDKPKMKKDSTGMIMSAA